MIYKSAMPACCGHLPLMGILNIFPTRKNGVNSINLFSKMG